MRINWTKSTVRDIPEVLQMMEAFNAIDNYPFDTSITQQNLLDFLSNPNLGSLWLIRCENETVGYIILTYGFSFEYRGRDAFIDEFFIKEAFRNQGIGRKTLEFIQGEATLNRVKALHLEVERHNTDGNHLYIKQGFFEKNRALLTKIVPDNLS